MKQNVVNPVPCNGISLENVACFRRESCIRYLNGLQLQLHPNRAHLIVGVNVKDVKNCMFYLEVGK